ncbi:MAG: hypothetical protein M0027_08445 [Candidatus Dormibacteraeota bacterium]|nr:hypothetical protein [Candidatus Dormibacteraeota bacterium]
MLHPARWTPVALVASLPILTLVATIAGFSGIVAAINTEKEVMLGEDR